MNSHELLVLIGEAKDEYVFAAKAPARRSIRKPLLIAAVVTLLLALVGCGVAIVLSLEEMKLGEEIVTDEYSGQTEARDMISLQGLVGSSNYQAAKEWYDFEQTYDPDGAIRASIDQEDTGIPAKYAEYGCYTQEMQEKIDEICSKYGLNIRGRSFQEEDIGIFFDAIGISGIISGDASADVVLSPGYFYEDGSFQISGNTKLTGADSPWIYDIEYQFRCVMKDTFDTVYLSVGDAEDYGDWTYTLPDGTEVLLALSEDKALLIADTSEFFVTVNVLNPRVGDILYGERAMDRAAMEAFADTFDLSFLLQKPDVEAALRREEEIYEAYQDRQEQWQNSDENPENRKEIAEYLNYLLEYEPKAESLYYGLYDLNGDTVPELLIGNSASTVGQVVQFMYDEADVNTRGYMDGMYLCENGIVEKTDPQEEGENFRVSWFTEYTDWGRRTVDCIIYAPEVNPDHPWFRSTTGSMYESDWEPISEEEYNAVREKYIRVEVELKPISEFSLE